MTRDDELSVFGELVLGAVRDSPSTARFLYDATIALIGGELPHVHGKLLAIGKRDAPDWFPGDGSYERR